MSQKDRDYILDSSGDTLYSDDDVTTPTTGLSQSFDVCDLQSQSTPAPHLKYVGKRKWGSKKRPLSTNLLGSPHKLKISKKICTSRPQASTVNPLPPVSPKEMPLARLTTAETKLGVSFEFIEKVAPQELIVRAPDLREQEVKVTKVTTNIVIDPSVLEDILDSCAVCKVCTVGRLQIWDKGTKTCFASYLTLRCNFCHSGKDFWTVSGKFQSKIEIGTHKITKRNDSMYQCILGGRLIGIGKYSLDLYHSMIGIGLPPGVFVDPQRELLLVAEFIAQRSMNKAAIELENEFGTDENNLIHSIASFDGAYQKRSTKSGGGYSRYCFGSAISMFNGKVLAYDVACNSCSACTRIDNLFEDGAITEDEYIKALGDHKANCPALYAALSSVSLESEIAPSILEQALTRRIIFDGLVCDGDNKTFSKISELKPYEVVFPGHVLKRFECLAHVGKRMKVHLMDEQDKVLKAKRADKKRKEICIEDTVAIEFQEAHKKNLRKQYAGTLVRTQVQRGSWTDALPARLFPSPVRPSKKTCQSKKDKAPVELKYLSQEMCARITSFYQLAVKQHLGDSDTILKSIKAIPLHLGANEHNATTNHSLCPTGPQSWCRYQKAIAAGEKPPRHPNYLSVQAVELVCKIFRQFHYDEQFFVNQIADGQTSNHNECLHSLLFSMVRKTGAVGMDVMKLGSALAVIRYNEGIIGVLDILKELKVTIHPSLVNLLTKMDISRVNRSIGQHDKQKRRFASRMKHQRKRTASIRLFGRDYESGKYSASNLPVSHTEIAPESLPSTVIPEVIPQATSSSTPTSSTRTASEETSGNIICTFCGKGDEDGTIDSLNICVRAEILNWVQCDFCDRNYHFHCAGLDEAGEITETDFMCDICQQSN